MTTGWDGPKPQFITTVYDAKQKLSSMPLVNTIYILVQICSMSLVNAVLFHQLSEQNKHTRYHIHPISEIQYSWTRSWSLTPGWKGSWQHSEPSHPEHVQQCSVIVSPSHEMLREDPGLWALLVCRATLLLMGTWCWIVCRDWQFAQEWAPGFSRFSGQSEQNHWNSQVMRRS